MTTRLYFPLSVAAPVSPAFDPGWSKTTSAVRRALATERGSDSITAGTAISFASPGSALDHQYVGPPMAADTISGTVSCQIQVKETAAEDDVTSFIAIKVVSNDGATVRGTLLALGNQGESTEFATTFRNKTFANAETLSSVICQAGDRVVVELGFSTDTGITPEAAATWGTDSAKADLPQDEVETATLNPWIEFSQTLKINQTVDLGPNADGIGSAEAFGTAQVNLHIDLVGKPIQSEEAFGTPSLTSLVQPAGVGSAEAFGAAIVAGPVEVIGIASEETFGTAQVGQRVWLTGIASSEAFGAFVVAGPIAALSIGPGGLGEPIVWGEAMLSIQPDSGSARGGTIVALTGALLDMRYLNDDFADGVLGSLWSDASTGSGGAVEVEQQHAILLRTGTTPGSAAVIETVDQASDIDVEAVFRPEFGKAAVPATRLTIARLYLRTGAGDTADLALKRLGDDVMVQARATVGGDVSELATVVGSGRTQTWRLRLLRAANTVYAFLSGALVFQSSWVPDPAVVGLAAENHVSVTSQVGTFVDSYLRRPVITFDGSPMILGESISRTTFVGATPPSVNVREPDTVDVAAVGANDKRDVLERGFSFVRGEVYRYVDGARTATVCNDLVLRRRR